MSNSTYTENMAEIMACSIERKEVLAIMQAWDKNGLPDNFYLENVRFAYNRSSGYVFLVNDDYQCVMMNGDVLEMFYTSPYEGREGFIEDLFDAYMGDTDAWHIEDAEWLLETKSNLDFLKPALLLSNQ